MSRRTGPGGDQAARAHATQAGSSPAVGQGGQDAYSRRDILKIAAAVGTASLLAAPLLKEALRQGHVHRVTATRFGLGTLIALTVLDDDRKRAHATIEAAFAEVERLESLLSRHRPSTPVAQLNREGTLDAPPPELVTVLREAQTISRLSEGAFDVTVAPLLSLYERSYRAGAPPRFADVERTRRVVGHEALRVGRDEIRFDQPGMAVTLDGIAKGYVVDAVVQRLVETGYHEVLVDAGGDIGSAGALRAGWRIGIQHPRLTQKSLGVVTLTEGGCIATSGDYMQAFDEDFRNHPIIDPRTGMPAASASSATVVAESAFRADALSTAALVLGPAEGCLLIDALPGAEALLVAQDGRQRATRGWVAQLG